MPTTLMYFDTAPIPFEELLFPAVLHARTAVRHAVGFDVISKRAQSRRRAA
jgi:hypothetical protein